MIVTNTCLDSTPPKLKARRESDLVSDAVASIACAICGYCLPFIAFTPQQVATPPAILPSTPMVPQHIRDLQVAYLTVQENNEENVEDRDTKITFPQETNTAQGGANVSDPEDGVHSRVMPIP